MYHKQLKTKTEIPFSKHSIDKMVLRVTVIRMFAEVGPGHPPSFFPKIIPPVTGSKMEDWAASLTPSC